MPGVTRRSPLPDNMAKDYNVEIRVRNARLKALLKRQGYETMRAAAQASGISYSTIVEYMKFNRPLVLKNGQWSSAVIRLADFLKCLPEDLAPPQHYETVLAKNRADFEMDASDVEALSASLRTLALPADQRMMDCQANATLYEILGTLRPRYREVLDRRFGLTSGHGETLEAIAHDFGVNNERIRQIEERALRDLRHPAKQRKLRGLEPINAREDENTNADRC